MFKVLKRMTTRLNQERTLHKRKGFSRKYTLKTQSRGGEMAQQCLLCFQRIGKQFDSQQSPQEAQIRKKQTPLFLKTEKNERNLLVNIKRKGHFIDSVTLHFTKQLLFQCWKVYYFLFFTKKQHKRINKSISSAHLSVK